MEMHEYEAPRPPVSRRMVTIGPIWSLSAGLCIVLAFFAVKPGPLPFGATPPPDFVYWQPESSPWLLCALSVLLASLVLMAKTMHSRSWFVVVIAIAAVTLVGCCWFMMRAGVAVTAAEVVVRPGPFWSPDRRLPLASLTAVRTGCIRTTGKGSHYEPRLELYFPAARGSESVPIGLGVGDRDFPKWLDAAVAISALPAVQAAPHAVNAKLNAECVRHFAGLLDPDRQRLFYGLLSPVRAW